jgi:hypothetical protein
MSEASQGLRDRFVVVGDIDSILSSVDYGGIGSMAGSSALKSPWSYRRGEPKVVAMRVCSRGAMRGFCLALWMLDVVWGSCFHTTLRRHSVCEAYSQFKCLCDRTCYVEDA